ncbi:MAG: hypothetical protein EBX40_06080 [Gammaproteobacteria bacterium]|nr:hypothetical protein [Gammaproteobacteria bacterium]
MTEKLLFLPVLEHLEWVSPSIQTCIRNWAGSTPLSEIYVAKIDPQFAGGQALCEHYGVAPETGANCVIVEGIRQDQRVLAACISPVGERVDFNGTVRKALNARKVSLAPLPEVLAKTQMEYGSVTPFGLPSDWLILIDPRVIHVPRLIVGGGLVSSKLSFPGKTLLELPNATVLENLCKTVTD